MNYHIGTWSQQAKLMANDGAQEDFFGNKVSIDGGHVVVGAPYHDDKLGSAYIFVNDGNGNWSQQAKLTADDASEDGYFGYSVSLNGDHAVVGAYYDDDNGSFSGSAYIFVNNHNGSWSQQAKLTANDGDVGDTFGYSVSINGDHAVVGARTRTTTTATIRAVRTSINCKRRTVTAMVRLTNVKSPMTAHWTAMVMGVWTPVRSMRIQHWISMTMVCSIPVRSSV